MKCFENVNEDNVEEWVLSDAWELGFQNMTDMDSGNTAAKQKREEGGEDDSEEGQSSECISHSIALLCVVTPVLLDYVDQKGFEHSDITAARKIRTAMRRSLHQFTHTHGHYTLFLKIKQHLCKKSKVICDIL
jgi:hypothetical protein